MPTMSIFSIAALAPGGSAVPIRWYVAEHAKQQHADARKTAIAASRARCTARW